jgi:hypothetical protein
MNSLDLRDDDEDLRRLARELQEATAEEFLQMVRLLRAQPDGQVLGEAEFQVRDLAHQIAAKVVQAEVNARQKGATKAPA